MNTRFWIVSVLCLLSVLAGFAPAARAQATYPPRPQEGVFIADEANLIDPADKAKIRSTCEQLLSTKGTPLMVATITSMADHNASGWQIERYAMNLFDEWGIGHTDSRNSGILLLVSKNDRKVRIELGQSWSHDRDAAAASIVNNTIVPQFKAGHFSAGIREGVDALAKTLGAPAGASSPSLPANSGPVGQPRGFVPSSPLHSTGMSTLLGPIACIVIPIVFIVIISIVSRIGRGIGGGGYGGGYGPVGWGGGWGGGGGGFLSGAILGGLLGNAWGSRRGSGWYGGGGGSSSGGGFGGGGFGGGGGFSGGGGGSFGGGFSGGGGATGSW